MTPPKRHLPEQFVEITRRTTGRQFLLAPGAETRHLIGYMYGKALLDHNQTASAACCMSNHFHAGQVDHSAQRSAFMAQFFSNATRKRNLQLGREENMWAVGTPGDMVLLELQDIIDKVVYICLQSVAAGCVERVTDWTGFQILPSNWGKTMRFKRPAHCGEDMPEFIEFTPMPPPGFEHLPLPAVIAFFEDLIRRGEERIARKRQGPVTGIRLCEAVNPYDAPKSNSPVGGLNPRFSSKNKKLIVEVLRHQRAFRVAQRECLNRFRAGERDIAFPAGTVQMALRAGVTCAPLAHNDPHLTRAVWTASIQSQWDDWLTRRAA